MIVKDLMRGQTEQTVNRVRRYGHKFSGRCKAILMSMVDANKTGSGKMYSF